jgi:hypothetical protein
VAWHGNKTGQNRESDRRLAPWDIRIEGISEKDGFPNTGVEGIPAENRWTDAKLDRIGKQLADQGLVQGEVAEELFWAQRVFVNVPGLESDHL